MRNPDPLMETSKLKPQRQGAGLSTKLLVLTVLFVLLAEVLIFVPSIANFRNAWLDNRLGDAELAVAALDPTTYGVASTPADDAMMQQVLLEALQAHELVLNTDAGRQVLASRNDVDTSMAVQINVDAFGPLDSIVAAFRTLMDGSNVLRIHGDNTSIAQRYVEVVVEEAYLREEMLGFSRNIIILSIVISLITAVMVYLSLNALFVRPLRRLDEAMAVFADAPEDPQSMIIPSGRTDELGTAEMRLASMQSDVRAMLTERRRLADLGLAVSKINHDLRNLLTSAHLLSERLDMIADPHVQRVAPKIVRAIDRAVSFCEATLAYGQVREAAPNRETFALAGLVDEAAEFAGLINNDTVAFHNHVDKALVVRVGKDNLFRILLNLMRNGRHALEASGLDGEHLSLSVEATIQDEALHLTVRDTGPGIREELRARLFQPFQGDGGRRGSTGLGLAIAKELAEADKGTIALLPQAEDATAGGAVFVITLADACMAEPA